MPPNTTDSEAAVPTSKDSPPASTRLLDDPGVVRMFRWMAVGSIAVLTLTTYGMLALRAAAPLSDPDTWWHLVMGHRFLDGASIQDPGPMSYFGTEDWNPRDWLTQILAASFEERFGLPGVAWLFGLGLVAYAVVLFRLARQQASFVTAAMVMPVALLASLTSLTARPQLVSFVLLAVVVGAMLRSAEDLRPRWWLALLTGAWACLHGMWFLGVAVQVVVIVGLALDRRLDRGALTRLGGVVVASLVAVGVTPNGLALLGKPLGTSLAIADHIQEYEPPTIQSAYYALALVMLGVTALVWARKLRPSWTQILLLVVAAGFTVQMQRTITIGVVIATPLFAEAVDTRLREVDLAVSKLVERLVGYGGALVALVALAFVAPSTADRPGDNLPVSFDSQLASLPEGTVLYNELSDGGYLTWRHPDLRIVEDGLSDQYSTDYHLDYFAATDLAEGWRDFFDRTGATYALVTEDHPLRQALELSGWQVTAEDPTKVLLQAPRTD